MKYKRIFVEKWVSNDCEGRYWHWKVAEPEESYDSLKEELMTKLNGWFEGVRLVEKVFDTDTWEITTKVLKKTRRDMHQKLYGPNPTAIIEEIYDTETGE